MTEVLIALGLVVVAYVAPNVADLVHHLAERYHTSRHQALIRRELAAYRARRAVLIRKHGPDADPPPLPAIFGGPGSDLFHT